MADARSFADVILDMENVALELGGYGAAVELIGTVAKTDGIDSADGYAIDMLGEVIRERVRRLDGLIAEGFALTRGGARG